MELPSLPVSLGEFIPYLGKQTRESILLENALDPFKSYESRLREVFAQDPTNEVVSDPHVNTVPVFAGHECHLKAKARQLDKEAPAERQKYILPLDPSFYNENGSPVIVQSIEEFKNNFRLFSESSLVDMDWSNVVAAGSSVTTCLLPVPEEHAASKRAQRSYYHDKLAPASDVDLFIYGLDEEKAIQKIKDIERCITNSILEETTVIRTKNALTIASKYPTRHVQIVLRLYKSVSEILTGFDVDCSCTAFDGSQVWANPRALSAFVTQVNSIDLTRRSPSYENRLAKYAHRGFEVHWPNLDRSKIDPTIFERSFSHVLGLARLLVMEKLPTSSARERYLDDRRAERERPASTRQRFYHNPAGNLKEQQPEDVPEWVEDEDVSNYHTFTIPYGPKYTARKIEKLLYKKDLLLNAEWNRHDSRTVNLHRHPAFFGAVQHVIDDCCGFCPSPITEEEVSVAAEESKKFVSGKMKFMKDDPGRQAIGSFNPITDSDWTEMAYISDTSRLCQAIVAEDIESVKECCSQEGFDIDQRDYTGRTPLHLAIMCSTPDIVQYLLGNGARVVARVAGGFTALHLAAIRGNAEIVRAILRKSEENKAETLEKPGRRGGKRSKPEADKLDSGAHSETDDISTADDSEEVSMVDAESDTPAYATTEGSIVDIRALLSSQIDNAGDSAAEEDDEPNFYDHPDILSWDNPVTPLHLAILNGHSSVAEMLVTEFGADVLRPVVMRKPMYSIAKAILSLMLVVHNPLEVSKQLLRNLLDCGGSCTQADTTHLTAFHAIVAAGDPELLDILFEVDGPAARLAIDHPTIDSYYNPRTQLPLSTTIKYRGLQMTTKLLGHGASLSASSDRLRNFWARHNVQRSTSLEEALVHPLVVAAQFAQPSVIRALLSDPSADLNAMTPSSYIFIKYKGSRYPQTGETILDIINSRISCWERIKFTDQAEDPTIPELEADSFYLEGLKGGSYQYWSAQNEICAARTAIKCMENEHKSHLKKKAESQGKDSKKEERKQRQIHDLEEIKQLLTERGAKTFSELHPELISKTDTKAGQRQIQQAEEQPGTNCPKFGVSQRFRDPDLGKVDKSHYLQLFEAAWDGDVQKVKDLTLGYWGPDNKFPPLRVSVMDRTYLDPFAIAVIRGNLRLAKAILEIADVQYLPKTQTPRQRRYQLVIDADSGSDSDSDDDSNEEHGIGVRYDLVDQQHTIDDIRDIANTVKSTVSPLVILRRHSNTSSFLGESETKFEKTFKDEVSRVNSTNGAYKNVFRSNSSKKELSIWQRYVNNLELGYPFASSLLNYAIRTNDLAVVKFLIEQEEKFRSLDPNEEDHEEKQKFITLPNDSFELAMSLGHTEIMGHFIAKTGAGFPFSALMKLAGVQVEKKPKYYQGLSVYGRKRQDWAAEGGYMGGRYPYSEKSDNPLLRAIMTKNLDSIRWFLSDQPEMKYREFGSNYKEDERIKVLSESEGGFQSVVSSWLGARRHLALHCAVIARPDIESGNSTVELTLQQPWIWLNAKNSIGLTPLHLAFSFRRIMAAKALLKAGADPTLRDTLGRNVLHLILYREPGGPITRPKLLSALCDILGHELIKQLAIQRTAAASSYEGWGMETPLAGWLRRYNHHCFPEMLRAILEATGGKELYMMDGRGNYPIHQAVKMMNVKIAQIMLEFDPALARIENATGVTPLELSESKLLRSQLLQSLDLSADIGNHTRFLNWEAVRRQYESQLEKNDNEPSYHDPSPFSTLDTNEWRMAELFRKTVLENPSRRKLVSLHDANQLVKRLGDKCWKRPGQSQGQEDSKERDESVYYMRQAAPTSFEIDPFT